MYAKVDQLAKRERESLIDRLLDLDPAALPEEKQGKKNVDWFLQVQRRDFEREMLF